MINENRVFFFFFFRIYNILFVKELSLSIFASITAIFSSMLNLLDYFPNYCGITAINPQQYRSWSYQYRPALYIGILFRTRSLVSPAKCGERSESEANFCARFAVRHRVGRVAGGNSAIRNGICPFQTLLPRLFQSEKHYESPLLPPTTRRKRGAVDVVGVAVVVVVDADG